MKKRIVSLFLVLVVLCSGMMLAGCEEKDKEKTPSTDDKSTALVINEALNKNANLDSMSAVMKMEIDMESEGMTMSLPITANIKAKNLKSDNAITFVDMKTSVLGQEIALEMYQEGQWAYIVMDDVKYKSSIENLQGEADYANTAKNMLKEIPEDILKDVKLVKAEDGSQTATIYFSEEKFLEIYDSLIKDAVSQAGTETENLKISDMTSTITIANGFVTVHEIAFKMDATVEDISFTTEVKVTLTYENIGQEVTITPPEDYQNFEELSMDDSLF